MAYTPQNWENLPKTTTAIIAERLKHMEEGIYQISNDLENVSSVNLNLNNGYEANSNTDKPMAYKKNGIVYLFGLIDKTEQSENNITTLPEGYRPTGTYNRFVLPTSYHSNSFVWVNINSNGIISFMDMQNKKIDAISLSGISFIAQN